MKILTALSIALIAASTLQAAPKKLLVVTTTSSFRHSSIPTAEKILAQLAKDSGEFTVDFVQQPPGHPAAGFPAKLKPTPPTPTRLHSMPPKPPSMKN